MIYLCAGHSSEKGHNYDSGAVATHGGVKITEAQLTVELRDKIVAIIAAFNAGSSNKIEVRTDQDNWNYVQTIQGARTNETDVVVDLHFNAATPAATGVEVFIPKLHTEMEKELARMLAIDLSQNMNIVNRGVKREDQCRHGRLGIMRPSGCNILIEVCFMTNENDYKAYRKNIDKIAALIAAHLIEADNKLK